jgi:large subunit ribosomal protein L22
MDAKASAKYLQGSAQKARLVVDMIRGKNVNEALAILQFANKRAAAHVEKCLRSAIANATETAEKSNVAVDPDELWVKACYVDMGPTKRRFRFRPAPQGRAYRERRHFCHVTVHLSSDERAGGRGAKKKGGASDKQSARGGARKGAAAAKAPAKKASAKGSAGKSDAKKDAGTERAAAQDSQE